MEGSGPYCSFFNASIIFILPFKERFLVKLMLPSKEAPRMYLLPKLLFENVVTSCPL